MKYYDANIYLYNESRSTYRDKKKRLIYSTLNVKLDFYSSSLFPFFYVIKKFLSTIKSRIFINLFYLLRLLCFSLYYFSRLSYLYVLNFKM